MAMNAGLMKTIKDMRKKMVDLKKDVHMTHMANAFELLKMTKKDMKDGLVLEKKNPKYEEFSKFSSMYLLMDDKGKYFVRLEDYRDYVLNLIDELLDSEIKMMNAIEDVLPNIITSEGMSLKEAGIIVYTNDIAMLSTFLHDILLDVYRELTASESYESSIDKDVRSFAVNVMTYTYGNTNDILAEILNFSDESIPDKDNRFSMLLTTVTAGAFGVSSTPFQMGFAWSPVYTLRKMWVDFSVYRAERLEYDNQEINLRIQKLRLENSQPGTRNKNIERYIEVLEDKIIINKHKIESLRDL